jgi:hypothetical protein
VASLFLPHVPHNGFQKHRLHRSVPEGDGDLAIPEGAYLIVGDTLSPQHCDCSFRCLVPLLACQGWVVSRDATLEIAVLEPPPMIVGLC